MSSAGAILGRRGRRKILARVLRNMRAARLGRRRWPAAVDAIDLLSVLEPTDPEHVRDRGLPLGPMGRFGAAIAALRTYLDERPDAQDVSDVRQVIGIFAGRRNEPVPLGADPLRQPGAPTRGL